LSRCCLIAAIKASQHTSIPHLLSIDPEGTLLEALEIIHRHHIHRLPVLQRVPENSILCMLTHQRILNFVLVKVCIPYFLIHPTSVRKLFTKCSELMFDIWFAVQECPPTVFAASPHRI
jgi:CBS domain-containing protein